MSSQFIYTSVINMKLLAVATPPSIYQYVLVTILISTTTSLSARKKFSDICDNCFGGVNLSGVTIFDELDRE